MNMTLPRSLHAVGGAPWREQREKTRYASGGTIGARTPGVRWSLLSCRRMWETILIMVRGKTDGAQGIRESAVSVFPCFNVPAASHPNTAACRSMHSGARTPLPSYPTMLKFSSSHLIVLESNLGGAEHEVP